jgi:hypothetical protein
MLPIIGRLGIVAGLAVVAGFALGFVCPVELVDGLRSHASVNREVGLDCLVHADQKLVSLGFR